MSGPHKSESPGGTGQIANLKTDTGSVAAADLAVEHQKQIANLRAQFALRGHSLQIVTRAEDGRETYRVSRWDQSRSLTSLHDVQGFLNQIGGAHV